MCTGKHLRRICLYISIATLLAACATVPLASPDLDAQARQLKPPPGKALLYVYRKSALPVSPGGIMDVSIDGNKVFDLAVKTYAMVSLPPGKHLVTSFADPSTPIYAKAGQIYFVRVSTLSLGGVLVDEDQARKDLESCKLIFASDKPIELTASSTVFSSPQTPEVAKTPIVHTGKEKLAVLDLDSSGVDSDLAYSMSVALRDELHEQGKYEVLSREDLLALAKRISLQQQTGDCTDDQCLVSYGRALGTRYMVAGVISKVGSVYSISLRLLDTNGDNPGIVSRASERCKCAEEELFQTVAVAAAKLLKQL